MINGAPHVGDLSVKGVSSGVSHVGCTQPQFLGRCSATGLYIPPFIAIFRLRLEPPGFLPNARNKTPRVLRLTFICYQTWKEK
jgi:hypothetical protein